ncbi:MAG TPA: polysaccharide deacetylase family protein [Leeuwenhoekiella sp.]|nr:polysaccharide deacetylase family protein [Leeuwenhoekiella sp.]
MPLPVKMPRLIKWIYPNYLWDKKRDRKGERTLYLTFDDGPIPEVTPWVLQLLEKYNAKATFFLIGENIDKHPDVFKEVLRKGHRMGNHTYNHLNGRKTDTSVYMQNITKTAQKLDKNIRKGAPDLAESYLLEKKLFRPPYGKIKKEQAKLLKQEGYQIVLYDTLAYDWEQQINAKKCAKNVLNNAENGSIVLFHDSLKAFKNLQVALPQVLEHFSAKGFAFKAL